MTLTDQTHQQVQQYYGIELQGSSDLRTSACCCSADSMPMHLRPIIKQIEPEVLERFYGCGSPIPPALEGCTVLDLGCGTGRDSFICSKLVGPNGRVIGLDMTDQQLDVARRHVDAQAERFGFERSNVRFVKGYLEDLAAAGIEEDSVDVVISNCVLNLSPDKPKVFSEIFRVLKPGGELYFSDVFADRRLPTEWMADSVLTGECLAGAMYIEDFRRLLTSLGVPDSRVVAESPFSIDDPQIGAKVGQAKFRSVTVRAFKLDDLEDRCEDYGQVAYYRGTIDESPHVFDLDDHHRFVTAKPMLVCGNTASMLSRTRFASHFRVEGDRSPHFGLFPCGPEVEPASSGACC